MHPRIIITRLFLALFFLLLMVGQAVAYLDDAAKISTKVYEILKAAKVTQLEIKTLAKFNQARDITKAITHYLPETRKAILLAIAEERGILEALEADDLYRNIGKVDGFENVAKLLCAANPPNVKGALYELRAANAAYRNRFAVVKIRNEFYGGDNFLKSDVDVLLKTTKGNLVAIECKSYVGSPTWDQIADKVIKMEEFARQNKNVKIVFSFENEPSKLVDAMLRKKKILSLSGDLDAQMKAISLLY